jgi:N-methylhydantoinase A
MTYRVGIDIGGTFTDIVLLGPAGHARTVKVPSTPADYSLSIVGGLTDAMTAQQLSGQDIVEVIHGTTVATNAILEKRGARTGLITTAGFRDVLEIRRLRMPRLYDLNWEKPEALVRRENRQEVEERVDANGDVVRPLDEATVRRAVARLLDNGVEIIAVTLLNSYANDSHERRILELIREADNDIPVCLSCDIHPEIKEYERTSTTVVNAYIVPVVSRYLTQLASVLHQLGVAAPLRIMQSNGGTMGVEAAADRPVHIIESGPSAGVVGAAAIAKKLGFDNVLTFDMGGTTAKAAMVEHGRFDRVSDLDVGAGINVAARLLKGGGYHVSVPAIDIAEVGAGGGSLIRIDAGGALSVGPESAGAEPGPVCYGQGGTTPTVTDGNVVLGYISPDYLVGGALKLDRDRSANAIEEQIAQPLGVHLDEAAFGIHRVADATMSRALRSVSSERGRDPRQFVLFAFGGNGPVHAASLARSLGITTVLIPPAAGVFSALGLLFPPLEYHFVRTFKREFDNIGIDDMERVQNALEAEGAAALQPEGYVGDAVQFEHLADVRYRGENSTLTVSASSGDTQLDEIAEAFGREHERTYGYRSDDESVELVNLRLIARGLTDNSRIPDALVVSELRGAADATKTRHRDVYFGPDVGRVETAIIGRAAVLSDWLEGPLIVEEYDSTTVVPPGARVRCIEWNMLEMQVDAK